MDLHASAVATLGRWRAPTRAQEALRRAYLAHLAAHPDATWRDGPPEHLTASCFVLDQPGERVLLSFHRKGRFWVQFGGHCERGDPTLFDVARREAVEESGLDQLSMMPEPLDLNRHALPPQFGRCREHLDVAFVAVAPVAVEPRRSAESDEVAWWPIDRLPDGVVPDLPPRVVRAATVVRGDAASSA